MPDQGANPASGARIDTRIDTVCLHGDEPGAVAAARAVRERLEGDGVVIGGLPRLGSTIC